MKTKLLQTLLLLFGITATHGQVNLSEMPNESTDRLQKSKIRYFSPGKGVKGRVCSPVNWAPGSQQAGYSTQNDSGLRHGTYILYLNVNGKVYSEKVTL